MLDGGGLWSVEKGQWRHTGSEKEWKWGELSYQNITIAKSYLSAKNQFFNGGKQLSYKRERVPGPEWSAASSLTKVQSPENRHRKMSREDERGLGGLDPSGVSDLSLKSKNLKKQEMTCRKSESLIKSWSTWDLARLAPEQANYLDWFERGGFPFSAEPRMKKREKFTDIRRCCLTSLLACLLACLLGVKNEMGRASCLVFYREKRVTCQGLENQWRESHVNPKNK